MHALNIYLPGTVTVSLCAECVNHLSGDVQQGATENQQTLQHASRLTVITVHETGLCVSPLHDLLFISL